MNKEIKPLVLSAFLCICAFLPAFGQKNSEKGDRYFDQNVFDMAIKYYLMDIHSPERKTSEYALRKLANCYRITGEFEMAETIFKKILTRKKKDAINYLNYGLALKNSAKYAEAKIQFEEYIKLNPDDPMGTVYLLSCDFAQLWLDETIGKEVKNLEKINTEFSEFSPAFNNGGWLSFSSSRNGSTKALISFDGGGDLHRLDLYNINIGDIETKEIDKNDIENFKVVNTPLHEGSACFSADGKEIYFTKTIKGKRDKEKNEILGTLQIFYSCEDSTGNWSVPQGAFNFNSPEYSVGHPSLSKDGNTIYFMSDKPGGLGKTDIYYAKKSTDGKWGAPINAGSLVNTFGHELFPYISESGVLYFSSDAHPGMGQLDIFKAENDNGKWANVQNLKPPFNSIANDFGISYDGVYQRGFFSSDRFNGKGAEDIYSFSEEIALELKINDDTIKFKDASVFDDIKYRLVNVADSSETGLVAENGSYELKISGKGGIVLMVTKNGLPYNRIYLNCENDSLGKIKELTLRSTDKPIRVKGILRAAASAKTGSVIENSNSSMMSGSRAMETIFDGQGNLKYWSFVEPGLQYFLKGQTILK
ncbi:MAG: hypothetical protein V4635_02165 [Bacteroidota bacterium]